MSRATMAFARLWSWDLYALAFLSVWHFIYFFPVTLGQSVFIGGDILYSFLPFHTELARALAEGRLPLWTPGIQAGFPLFAEGEVGALYLPNLIFHWLLPAPVALSYIILFNWSWASVGMYLLSRTLKLEVAGSLLAGLVFGCSGFMIARAPHVPLIAVASWLPWLVIIQIQFWRSKRAGKSGAIWFLLIALAMGFQILGGHPQLAIVSLAIAMFVGFAIPFLQNRQTSNLKTWLLSSLRQLPLTGLLTLVALALGIGLVAIQLVPMAELVFRSTRGQELGKTFFTSFSFAPAMLAQFVFPFQTLGAPTFFNTEYWGYVGLLPLALAVAAPIFRRDLRTWVWLALALGALVLALGGNTPLYDWLYDVPVFNRLRVPARFLFLFTFAAAYLAGVGLQELSNRLGASKIDWKHAGLGLTLAAAIFIVVAQANAQPSAFWLDLWTRLPWLWLILSITLIALAARRLMGRTSFAMLALGITLIDLAAFAAPFSADATQTISPAEILATPRTVRVMDAAQSVSRFLSDKWPSTSRASIRNALLTNVALIYDEQSATAYEPSLAIQRNVEYADAMMSAMRNLLNVRYYLIPLEALPWDDPPSEQAEPAIGLNLDALQKQPAISPTHAARLDIVSYTTATDKLPDGFVAGEIILTLDSQKQITIPLRLGVETADWAYDGIAKTSQVNHSKPANSIPFLAYLSSVGSEFQGRQYSAQFNLSTNNQPAVVTAIGVHSFLPDAGLRIESIRLIDESGQSVSLASLLQQNDLALVFRSHTAAMWENRDVLSRAFVVHQAEIVSDDQMLARMRQPDFVPDQIVLLSEGKPLASTVTQVQDQVNLADYQAQRVTIDVQTNHAGYLVLADSWYPGWQARVDGQVAPIYRADYIFRAVEITPGQHRVVFEYRPDSLVVGALISGLSAVILLSIVGIMFWHDRNKVGASAD